MIFSGGYRDADREDAKPASERNPGSAVRKKE
jgi:hypothetical protein